MFQRRWLGCVLLCLVLGAGMRLLPVRAAEPAAPPVEELRVQRVGDVTFFHVIFKLAFDVDAMAIEDQPRLVPQDGKARAIYPLSDLRRGWVVRRSWPLTSVGAPAVAPRDNPSKRLEFLGQLQGQGELKFRLVYPEFITKEVQDADRPGEKRTTTRTEWRESDVVLDFGKASVVKMPADARKQRVDRPAPDDIEGLWAVAQRVRLVELGTVARESRGFYSFAETANSRQYGLTQQGPGLNDTPDRRPPGGDLREEEIARQYEITTGADAIAESLQLRRMRQQAFRDPGPRKLAVDKVTGIDIAEHPWEKMMAGKKPADESLARLVPHDQYYLAFKNIRKFIELSELLDQWGTNAVRAFEVTSRDYRLKERYEKQLCLRSTWLGKTLGPALLRGVAMTGSDPYLREGTDVSIIFHVTNKPLFLGAVERFIREARMEFRNQLREDRTDYQGVTIESHVTPLREVSLHRATLGDFVVYSNSPAGVRRIIDTHQGKRKSLANGLDFQYMRTVFRADDAGEDGFVFLSDPFIRNLVGPATRIKEKRRLEAITSMYMLNYAALWNAWETGKLPATRQDLLAAACLKPEEVYDPDGKDIAWNPKPAQAVSETYNTIHFATPLVELPIDLVTEQEARDYERFRLEYLGLWRQYFDPIGMRVALRGEQVKLDTYILPLIKSSTYNQLRDRTGAGTTVLDTARMPGDTLVQFLMHINPTAPERRELLSLLANVGGKVPGTEWLGDWLMIRLQDGEALAKLAMLLMQAQQEGTRPPEREATKLLFQVPVTVGLHIKNPLVFAGVLTGLKTMVKSVLPNGVTWEPMEPAYKGVSIVRIQATREGVANFMNVGEEKDPFLPAIYYVLSDGGGFYASLTESAIKQIIDIDDSVARKEGKAPVKGEKVDVNNALYVSPEAAKHMGGVIRAYLEAETRKRALDNEPLLYLFYRAGLATPETPAAELQETARRFLGYVPVSPDGADYRYDPATDEVKNSRHGTLRQPKANLDLAAGSPVETLLQQLRTIRADLRFREDGIHTTITLEHKEMTGRR